MSATCQGHAVPYRRRLSWHSEMCLAYCKTLVRGLLWLYSFYCTSLSFRLPQELAFRVSFSGRHARASERGRRPHSSYTTSSQQLTRAIDSPDDKVLIGVLEHVFEWLYLSMLGE